MRRYSFHFLLLATAFGAYALGIMLGITTADRAQVVWLEKWQTLAASWIALAGAILGSFFLYHQITQTNEMEQERRQRRLGAIRAVLPLSLSAVIEYVTTEADLLNEAIGGASIYTSNLPVETVVVLKEFVEFANPNEAHSVRKILSDIQIHNARMRADRDAVRSKSYLKSNVARLLSIYARAAELFAYARFETNDIDSKLTLERLEVAAYQTGFFEDEEVMGLLSTYTDEDV